jgi:hypothetical protein
MRFRKLIAFDPGTHCGWAIFEGEVSTNFGTVDYPEELMKFLLALPKDIDAVVIEDYKVRDERHGGFDHLFQNVTPAKVIGVIEFYAFIRQIPFFLQQPQIKYSASPMILGKPYKKQGNKHHFDAFLHGMYFIKTREKK